MSNLLQQDFLIVVQELQRIMLYLISSSLQLIQILLQQEILKEEATVVPLDL